MIGASLTLDVTHDRLAKVFADVRSVDTQIATVGISPDRPPHPVFGNGSRTPVGFVSIARLAAVHEYGGSLPTDENKSPPRPFLGPTFDERVELNFDKMRDAMGKVLDGAFGTPLLREIAKEQLAAVRQRMRGFIGPELAARTKRNRQRRAQFYAKIRVARGVSDVAPYTPLIDGGRLYDTLSAEVLSKARFAR